MGEVVIQGPTILREYLSDPIRSRESILTKLPSWVPKRGVQHWGRFYKSGDLAFYNADGTMEFAGRKDTQIKIRGLRVELGEVEYQIQSAMPHIRQVAVDVLKTDNGSTLVCYFCSTLDGKSSSAAGVTVSDDMFLPLNDTMRSDLVGAIAQLKVILPRYMVPTHFVQCRFMPFITSTKLDRKKLREVSSSLSREAWLQYSQLDGPSFRRPPSTEMERILQQIWADVLSLPLPVLVGTTVS